jgi:4-amino-4-deoxy-L-arabinose transferase-like glycosyltransferase
MRDNLSRSTLFRTSASRDHSVTICYVLMGLALAAGTYFRLKGLAKSPFAIDEYYIASSVRNILEHGLPQFDCGGYYTRGLLLQYLAAPLFKYGSNDELYFRLITVISNLLTIPALYLLGKRIAGRAAACFVVVLFSVSIWETEMARFARMYAPFQMLFIWYLYFLYKALILTDATARKWMYWISLISIFVSEEAIFLNRNPRDWHRRLYLIHR